jgi:hypothetical protein
MMSRHWTRCNGIRLTHKPTGLSVTVWQDGYASYPRRPSRKDMLRLARSWLAAKLAAHRERGGVEPARDFAGVIRTYTLDPEYAAGVREVAGGVKGRRLAEGREGVERFLRGGWA